ncbi:hypothetical protein [Gelidibacter gilvus]|uniref:Uncharacterized protein n=1 Tax=Gelidibacter gilvus TaxID=59602 RepID=A0A4Q0XEA6_9FLAO|nr:hypothetical protein [Gelidibacter gilvus]RXJ49468.1 hypothetical protein ESZ48_12730 [Gelidibacter gilvus]
MKKHFKLIIFVLFVMGISCKEQPETKTTQDENKATTQQYEEYCYLYAQNKDTIALMLTQSKNLVIGEMFYNFFEKDGSYGSFEGIVKGDTIFGDYDFESEGTTSKRELIFLKKGNTLLEGYGEVEVDRNNTTVFKSNTSITFDEKFPLTAVNCDELNF